MSRRRKALVGIGTAACCMASPAVSAAHGPPKITAGPEGTVTATEARFEFTYDEPAPTQRFECSLDGAAFAACEDSSLPAGFQTYANLAPGPHTFKVRRAGSSIPLDPLADEAPSERVWTVAAPEPDPAASPTPTPAPPPPPPIDSTKPAPCDGVFQITDAKGDWHHTNTDILGAFFRYANGAVTANIVVDSQNDNAEHPGNVAVFWRMAWTGADGVRRWVGANGARYETGTVTGTKYTVTGETQGTRFAGANGLVQAVVPNVGLGATLASPVAVTGEIKLDGSDDFGDRGPGGTGAEGTTTGADYVVRDCAAPAAAAPGPGGGTTAAGVSGVALDKPSLSVGYRRFAIVSGTVSPATAGVATELLDRSGKVLQTVATDAAGRFSFRLRVRDDLELKVRAAGVSSASLPVDVRPTVRWRKRKVRAGLRFTGRIRPAHPGDYVDIEQRNGGQWVLVKSATIRKGRFKATLRGVRGGRYRIVYQEAIGE